MTHTYPKRWSEWNVALAHDWLTGMRGGENVLEILCTGFPGADVFTLIHNREAISDTINAHRIHTSWLQSLPGIYGNYRNFLPFFPSAIKRFSTQDAELVISTSHCVAKGIGKAEHARHVCYCFTPMRYAWLFHDEYFGRNPVRRLALAPVLAWLRRWDRRRSDGVDTFVAISEHVRKRIRKFYDREAAIVYPPVDTDYYCPDGTRPGDFDLIVSALVPYKRVDLAVRTYTERNWPLKVVGTGGDFAKLQALAGPTVELMQWQSRDTIRDLYRRCRCLVFPGEEDFGIVPVEAQACGAPVVAYARGGALETVSDGVSGIFFNAQTEASLAAAAEHVASREWDPQRIRANAEQFSIQMFIDGLDRHLA